LLSRFSKLCSRCLPRYVSRGRTVKLAFLAVVLVVILQPYDDFFPHGLASPSIFHVAIILRTAAPK
jgi:hypothetical protein